jgi:amino-acid N-acetyltransferase
MLRLADLREILRYVPHFRERVFVIAMDGAIVEDANFTNLLLDIALLRSLRIGVVLVHGAGHQVSQLAQQANITPSNVSGSGVTDAMTFELALTAANRVTQRILEGLAATDLRAAAGNALVAHPAGILQGIDHQFTGRLERVDRVLLESLLSQDIVPVIPPLGCDGEGATYRLNSDVVAVEVARALQAVKLIYITNGPGICRTGSLVRQLDVEEAQVLLTEQGSLIPDSMRSKLEQAIRATKEGIPRVHVIDGRVEEGLLAEVFSNEGTGTLIYANEYQAIRRARKRDGRAILALMQSAMASEELRRRSLTEVESQLADFYVFEIDRSLVGCVAIHSYPKEKQAELASLCVDTRHENQGIGTKLMQFAEAQARGIGAQELFCLSTQAFNYFVHKGGFRIAAIDHLPPGRRDLYERSGRGSQILVKSLAP